MDAAMCPIVAGYYSAWAAMCPRVAGYYSAMGPRAAEWMQQCAR